jgi:hypothetical protein
MGQNLVPLTVDVFNFETHMFGDGLKPAISNLFQLVPRICERRAMT